MKALFLHGRRSAPGGVKPTFLGFNQRVWGKGHYQTSNPDKA